LARAPIKQTRTAATWGPIYRDSVRRQSSPHGRLFTDHAEGVASRLPAPASRVAPSALAPVSPLAMPRGCGEMVDVKVRELAHHGPDGRCPVLPVASRDTAHKHKTQSTEHRSRGTEHKHSAQVQTGGPTPPIRWDSTGTWRGKRKASPRPVRTASSGHAWGKKASMEEAVAPRPAGACQGQPYSPSPGPAEPVCRSSPPVSRQQPDAPGSRHRASGINLHHSPLSESDPLPTPSTDHQRSRPMIKCHAQARTFVHRACRIL
jgi:hypothetical protein